MKFVYTYTYYLVAYIMGNAGVVLREKNQGTLVNCYISQGDLPGRDEETPLFPSYVCD